MYIFYFILVLGVNIAIYLFSGDYDIQTCLTLCLINVITCPVFYVLLTLKSVINNPVVKDLDFSADFGDTRPVISVIPVHFFDFRLS
jgi:hypothetical protein